MAGERPGIPGHFRPVRHLDGPHRNWLFTLGLLGPGRLHCPRLRSDDVVALPATVDSGIPPTGARGRHRLAGLDFDFRNRAA